MEEGIEGEHLNGLRGNMSLTSIGQRNGQTKSKGGLYNGLKVPRIGAQAMFVFLDLKFHCQ